MIIAGRASFDSGRFTDCGWYFNLVFGHYSPPASWRVADLASLESVALVVFALLMRRFSQEAVDDLRVLEKALLAFRHDGNRGSGSRLPVHSDVFLVFLARQPQASAKMQELREQFLLGQSRTSRTCRALEREGLVETMPDPNHGKFTLVRLTTRGQRIVDEALAALRARKL
jgi:DNA-binding MarR family transcriptional regulator